MRPPQQVLYAKIGFWLLAPLPLLWSSAQVLQGLRANPVEYLLHQTGYWALVGLALGLAISPWARLSQQGHWIALRRVVGLWAFAYAVLHLGCYVLDHVDDLGSVLADVVKRPYITVGLAAWLILLALACTSTQAMMRRLKRRWGQLHRGVYLASSLGVLHFWWLVKRDWSQPLIFALVMGLLLLWRVPKLQRWLLQRRQARARARALP